MRLSLTRTFAPAILTVVLFYAATSAGMQTTPNQVAVAQQEGLTIGGLSSFAPAPPPTDAVKELFDKTVHLESGVANRPLPTNDWWTTLLSQSPFPGRLYAYPLTISADGTGLMIWYPQNWNDGGTELEAGRPLIVEPIDRTPVEDPSVRLLFDFESDWRAIGWSIEGNAFGDSPMNNAQHASRGFVGQQFAASFHAGDPGTGTATSPRFIIDKPYLHFKVAGGDDRELLGVHIEIDGATVFQEVGARNNDFTWKVLDLREFVGQQAVVRLVDESQGGWGFISADQFILSDHQTLPSQDLITHASTLDWGDWHVAMRLHVSASKRADVTFGRGIPMVWIEPDGVDLRIPGNVADGILVHDGRKFGIYAPDGELKTEGSSTEFSGPVLAVVAIPDNADGSEFAAYAAAIPRDTRFDWQYDRDAGQIETTWRIETSNNEPAIQGWIPHHYRTTDHDLNFTGDEFTTRRGRMRLAAGNEFKIAWPFSGITPAFPLPEDGRFDRSRLTSLINAWSNELLSKPEDQRHANDTYWGGKSMLKTAQAFTMARQLELPVSDQLLTEAKRVATDWLTYTDGEAAFYYARYPAPWNGLVGFNPSYGSEQFTDNHFHYGYLILTGALIGMHDREWLEQHRDGLREVVKQFSEWERDSEKYPRLRTFECWAGHSYAAGLSNDFDGNNQESSSEAAGAWAGVFLLGTVLDDPSMQATGAMGYAIETEAIHEYWNNVYGWNDPAQSNWSSGYEPTICSVVRDRDVGAWTWFSGEPIHIYGIQWLPAWTHSHYFGAHPEHSAYQLDQMMIRQGKEAGRLDWSDLDDDWGQVTTGFAAFCVPEEVCAALDAAFENDWPIASPRFAGIPYYLAHSSRVYGLVDSAAFTDLPTSLVLKAADGSRTAIICNTTDKSQVVRVFVDGREVLEHNAPPNSLAAVPVPRQH